MAGPSSARPLDVRRAAVIGAGVMGATIAAHLANAGVPTLLLDLKEGAGDRAATDRRARAGLEAARRARPAAFFSRGRARLVRAGNVEDDLAALAEADWVVEAVVERLDVKQQLYSRLVPHLHPGAVLSSNTSGLAAAELAAGLPDAAVRRFAVTHFFNPPRYLHLLELVAGPATDPAALAGLAAFCERRLGKGVVVAKDTPNFIANRIGMYGLMHAARAVADGRLSVAEVDALTGPLLGRPASATFRTADLVGLDTILHVAANLHERLTDDTQRDAFAAPAFLARLAEQGRLGAKSGAGVYRRTPEGIEMVDPATLGYVARPDVDLGLPSGPSAAKLAAVLARDDAHGAFLREHLGACLGYAAACVPEVADRLEDVDRAMRWGFGWRAGPFETWDALAGEGGVPALAARLAPLVGAPPPLVDALAASGGERFYLRQGARELVFVPASGTHEDVGPGPVRLAVGRRAASGGVVDEGPDARLVDVGDDVLCLEFRTKMNVLTPGVGEALQRALQRVERSGAGLLIGNDADDFSAGAHLGLVLAALSTGRFDEVAAMVDAFQALNQSLRFARRPVVVAARGRVLGGGCEVLLAARGVCAAAESYIGLVEVGAGLIPAGGGCKEWLRRADEATPPAAAGAPRPDPAAGLLRAFEAIGMGKVSGSAEEAVELGYLRPADPVVMNGDHLLADAKRLVLALAGRDEPPPVPRDDIPVMGDDGLAALRVALFNLAEAGWATPHDQVVSGRLAHVLSGGGGRARRVSEDELLALEKEAFLGLCGEPATRARMQHLLETGKPLRN